MFRFSDATRRQATMGLFVLLCAVPTVLVIAIGLWRCLPGRVAAEERRLTLLFGQPVHIESVRYLRPDTSLYEGLEVLDPETNEMLLRCDRLEAQLAFVRPKDAKAPYPQLKLSATKLTVVTTSTEALRPMADRLLQRRIEGAPTYVDLTAGQFVLADQPEEVLPPQLRGLITLLPQQSSIELKLQRDGKDTNKPVRLWLSRSRDYQPPVDSFELDTGDEPLPCSLLAALLPPFPELGPNSRFQGLIVGNHVPAGCQLDGERIVPKGWRLGVRADLQDIDLRKLVGNHVPHEISGLGSLRLEETVFRAGRVTSMQGALRAANGLISQALVASCVTELGLITNLPITGSAALPYHELAVRFQLNGLGLQLWGECSSDPAGALLVGTYTQRLDGPTGPIRPIKAIAALTSTPEAQLSISPHAARLMERVPIVPVTEIIADPRTNAQGATHY